MPTYSPLVFEMTEFDSKLDEISLSMTKIPSDDILESLCKLRVRESEKLKTVSESHNTEIHQKKAGPDYHRLKTMVKRSGLVIGCLHPGTTKGMWLSVLHSSLPPSLDEI